LLLLKRQPRRAGARLDVPGVLLVSSGVFCLVYGFSNAALHSWGTSSTWGFLIASALLIAAFAAWQGRTNHPLLPPRVVLDRNRGAAYLGILIVGAVMFGVFLFVTYYMQTTLGYSPVVSGVAFLPMVFCIAISANVSNIVLLPRIGPKPLIIAGGLLLASAQVWFTRIGLRGDYIGDLLGPFMLTGCGMGLMFSTCMNTGTYGVAPQDAGVASASVNTGQQLGGSIGTALLNTIVVNAVASYLTANARTFTGSQQLLKATATLHGYTTAFWWCAGLFLAGAVIGGSLMRRGPLYAAVGGTDAPSAAGSATTTATTATAPAEAATAGEAEPSETEPAEVPARAAEGGQPASG
jgi:hypothetical protein